VQAEPLQGAFALLPRSPVFDESWPPAAPEAAAEEVSQGEARQQIRGSMAMQAESKEDSGCSPVPISGQQEKDFLDVDHEFWWESGTNRSPSRRTLHVAEQEARMHQDPAEQKYSSSRDSSPIQRVLREENEAADFFSQPSVRNQDAAGGIGIQNGGLRRHNAEYPLSGLQEFNTAVPHSQILRELHIGLTALGLEAEESQHLLAIAESLGQSNLRRTGNVHLQQPTIIVAEAEEKTEQIPEEEATFSDGNLSTIDSDSGPEDSATPSGLQLEALLWEGVVRSGLGQELYEAGVVDFVPAQAEETASPGDAWTLVANLLLQWSDACQILAGVEETLEASFDFDSMSSDAYSEALRGIPPADCLEQMRDAQGQLKRLAECLPSLDRLQPFVESARTLARTEALVLKAVLVMSEERCMREGPPKYQEMQTKLLPLLLAFYTHIQPKCLEYIDKELQFIVSVEDGGSGGHYFHGSKQTYLSHYLEKTKLMHQSTLSFTL